MLTANVLTIVWWDLEYGYNPYFIWSKNIVAVLINRIYVNFMIQILFLLVSDNYGPLPIETDKNYGCST